MENKVEKLKKILSEFAGYIDVKQLDNIYHVDEIRDIIDDNGGFDFEIIYDYNAMKFLSTYDPSLKNSLEIAYELGYNLIDLSSEILASLLASQLRREQFEALVPEIEKILSEE